MACILLRMCFKNYGASIHGHSFLIASRFTRSSSNKPPKISQIKNLTIALRVLELISPKGSASFIARNSQTHLRLIQDFLRTESDQYGSQHLSADFSFPSSNTYGIPNVFSEIFESDSGPLVLGEEKLKTNPSVLSNAVSFCSSERNLRGGVQYHCVAIRTGFVANVYVGSCLISLYTRCGELEDAYQVFEEMPAKNVVSWTAIISGFAQECLFDMCLELFHQMRNSTLKPNDFTLSSILSACTGSGLLGYGRNVHCQTIQMGFESYIHIGNALISMYSKCGAVKDARFMFRTMYHKDTVSWNSMIVGYALQGFAFQAIYLFEEMKNCRIKPDAITFLGVLSSCRHAGLIKQGLDYLNSMAVHNLKPELDHYSCVIDLLGRAGLLEEARDLIKTMPLNPNSVIWGSLLSSCRIHGNVWIGIEAAEKRLLLEPDCAATHVQLANLYAKAGFWENAARLRKMMKDKGLRTSIGYSWIEIGNQVHKFQAEDKSNMKIFEIFGVIASMVDHMRSLGRELEEIEEEDSDYPLHVTTPYI